MEVPGRKLETQEEMPRDEPVLCEPCQIDNTKTKANGTCRECKEYMCNTCFRHHLKGKVCRNHVLLPTEVLYSMSLNNSAKDEEKCKKHENKQVKFYCRAHDIVGCGDCIVVGHATCKPEDIEDLAKSFQTGDEFANLVKKLEILESNKNDTWKIIQKNRDESEDMNEKALKEIRQFRSEIHNYLDRAEANIISEVQKLTSENMEIQRMLEQDVKSLTSEIQKVKQKLNTQLHGEKVLFINSLSCKSKLDDIEKMHAQMEQKCILKKFDFVRDETISGILNTTHHLGSLRKIKPAAFVVGARVRRGPDWHWGNQDGGGAGTVTGIGIKGWAIVTWDTGKSNWYRIGQQDAFELELISP